MTTVHHQVWRTLPRPPPSHPCGDAEACYQVLGQRVLRRLPQEELYNGWQDDPVVRLFFFLSFLQDADLRSLSVATGVLAGMTEAVVIVPFELVKIRLQDPQNVTQTPERKILSFFDPRLLLLTAIALLQHVCMCRPHPSQ